MNDTDILTSRFKDLAQRSDTKGIWTYSDFLSLDGQSELLKLRLSVNVELLGGYDGAERRIAVFGSETDIGYPFSLPITVVKIEPVMKKFADELTHRDFLGSLMGLGIKREVLGDIIISDNGAYLICLDSIADYIVSELITVKHTSVRCTLIDELPETAKPEIKYEEYVTSSDRLDGVIAAVYRLSRSESQALFAAGKIFVNGKMTENTSYRPSEGQVISVRGKGRFVYNGILRSTKKGRCVISAGLY